MTGGAESQPDRPANALKAESELRAQSPYSMREKLLRVLWWLMGQPIFRLTFHNWYWIRRQILRIFGAEIGLNVRIRPSVRIEQPWNLTVGENSSIGDRAIVYCLGKVTLGRNVSIAQHAHLCAGTHDFERPDMLLLKPPIEVRDNAWIAADAFVGPGVQVGEGAILGARGCAFKNLEAWTIYGGNPARPLRPRRRFEDSQNDSDGVCA